MNAKEETFSTFGRHYSLADNVACSVEDTHVPGSWVTEAPGSLVHKDETGLSVRDLQSLAQRVTWVTKKVSLDTATAGDARSRQHIDYGYRGQTKDYHADNDVMSKSSNKAVASQVEVGVDTAVLLDTTDGCTVLTCQVPDEEGPTNITTTLHVVKHVLGPHGFPCDVVDLVLYPGDCCQHQTDLVNGCEVTKETDSDSEEGVDTTTAKLVSLHSDTAHQVCQCRQWFTVMHNASGEHVTAKVVVCNGRTDEKCTATEEPISTKCVGVDTTTIHYVADAVKRSKNGEAEVQ